MKTIKLTDQELESMIQMYESELELAQLEVANIQEILKKLGAKPAKEVAVEKETKPGKKRGPKPSVKAVEIKERKKPGRKPKIAIPAVETIVAPVKPVKKEKVAKVKIEKKSIVKPTPIKKVSKVTPLPSAKSVPVAADIANTKAAKPKKEKVAKVKAEKPIKKVAEKATVESLVASLLTTAPKKEVAKIVKKKAPKKRTKGFVRLAPLGKPLTKKKVVDEPAPVEPIAPAEKS